MLFPIRSPKLPVAFQAALLMIIGCFFLAALAGFIRELSESGMHVFEIVFLRNLAGLAVLLPWLIKSGPSVLSTNRPGLFAIRSLFGFISMVSWFFAVTAIPLAEAVSLNFTAPIFGTLLAIIVLKEVVGIRRWAAVIIGFAGAMIILRPGTIEMSSGALRCGFLGGNHGQFHHLRENAVAHGKYTSDCGLDPNFNTADVMYSGALFLGKP